MRGSERGDFSRSVRGSARGGFAGSHRAAAFYCLALYLAGWGGDAGSVVQHRIRDRKVPIRYPPEAAGEFSSLKLSFCVDSYSVTVPPQCYSTGTSKTLVILPKAQGSVTPKRAYTLEPTKSEWADNALEE